MKENFLFFHCFRQFIQILYFKLYIIKLPPLKEINFIIVASLWCLPRVWGNRNEGIYFRGTRHLMSKTEGNKGLKTNRLRHFFPCIKTFLKVHVRVSLKVYKTASCAEIAGNYFQHWFNMTCEKVAINGPNLKKLAQKNSN